MKPEPLIKINLFYLATLSVVFAIGSAGLLLWPQSSTVSQHNETNEIAETIPIPTTPIATDLPGMPTAVTPQVSIAHTTPTVPVVKKAQSLALVKKTSSTSGADASSPQKSSQSSAVHDVTAPTIPAHLRATYVGDTQINLAWDRSVDNVGVVGYRLIQDHKEIGSTPLMTAGIINLSPGTIYIFSVFAYDAALNSSEAATPISVTTLGIQPTMPAVFAPPVTPNTTSTPAPTSSTPSAPTISISADPSSIASGSSAILSWSSTDATSCSASGGWSGAQSTSGSLVVSPTTNTSYSLSCSGDGGTGIGTVTVTVSAQGTTPPASTPAPTAMISASPSSIQLGSSATLMWSSTDATSCVASNGWSGSKATSGSQSVSPTSNVTYSLSCTGAGGDASQSTSVTVTSPAGPAPTVTISANPASIISGSSATLTWSSTNATACTASGGWSGTKATNGSQTVSPTTNRTYTLSCTGSGGSTSQAASVTVTAQPPGAQTYTINVTSARVFDTTSLSIKVGDKVTFHYAAPIGNQVVITFSPTPPSTMTLDEERTSRSYTFSSAGSWTFSSNGNQGTITVQ